MVGPSSPRSPDELFRDALALRALLDDLDPDEHAMRSRLLLARDDLRAEAAAAWRARGWRPITDSRRASPDAPGGRPGAGRPGR